MTVIKKSGQTQSFNLDKLRLSIENASDNCKAPMTSSDLDLIVKDVLEAINEISKEHPLTTYKIREQIIASLEKFGFTLVAKHYSEN